MQFDMNCPKCKTNSWILKYKGLSEKGQCEKTENVGTFIGIYGDIIITCKKCGYKEDISVGSD